MVMQQPLKRQIAEAWLEGQRKAWGDAERYTALSGANGESTGLT